MKKFAMIFAAITVAACSSKEGDIPAEWPWNDPDADDQLEFTVQGNGTFRAVCNGDATSVEVFTNPTMKLFHGQLVVVVQAGDKAGKATLTVKDRKTGMKQSLTIPINQ